jgi:hypothetical protein
MEKLCVEEKRILKWLLNKCDMKAWGALIWLRVGIKYRADVNIIMNLMVVLNAGSFSTSHISDHTVHQSQLWSYSTQVIALIIQYTSHICNHKVYQS